MKRGTLLKAVPKPAAPVAVIEDPSPAPAAPARQAKSKTREGKRNVTAYLDPAAFRQLKRLSADTDASMQDLLVEGLNLLFERHGLSRIA